MRKSLTQASLAAALLAFAAAPAAAGCGATAHGNQQSVQGAQTAQTPMPEKPAEETKQ